MLTFHKNPYIMNFAVKEKYRGLPLLISSEKQLKKVVDKERTV